MKVSDEGAAGQHRADARERGDYCAIGLVNPKSPENVGAVMRAAGCYGADEVYYTGQRFELARRFATDTKQMVEKIPLLGVDDLMEMVPAGCTPVLVDLPGYGYAEVPEAIRLQWQRLLEDYLTRRPNLVGLVLIMDSRHPLKDRDRVMIGWFAPSGRPIHVLLTKSDKLTRSEQSATLAAVRKELAPLGEQVTVQLFSSLKKTGIEEAERIVGSWLSVPDDAGPGDTAAP